MNVTKEKSESFLRYINTMLLMIVSALLFHVMSEFQDLKTGLIESKIQAEQITNRINLMEQNLHFIQLDIKDLKDN